EDDDEEDYSEMPKLPLTKEQKKAQKKLQRENKKLFAKLQKIADKRRTGQYSMEQIRIIMEDSFSKTVCFIRSSRKKLFFKNTLMTQHNRNKRFHSLRLL